VAVVVRFRVATTAAGVEADASVLLVVLGGPGALLPNIRAAQRPRRA